MSDSLQRMLLVFGAALVAMIALLLGLQIGFGSLATEEPDMINPRSVLVAVFFAIGLTFVFGGFGRDEGQG